MRNEKENHIDKTRFFASEKAEFQGEKVFFRYLNKFYFFCRLKIQTAFHE